ncbi:hypothetical protein FM101_14850 [Arthrobacter rhombi]|uniref:Uncharacterized protein n=1 Tax=Arthrobacter rhombi TaxID=71253 RepID=A0A1R4GW62_9MICC|nr:hypothetical protein FM101_14850 [Arthrobacter rhombi]
MIQHLQWSAKTATAPTAPDVHKENMQTNALNRRGQDDACRPAWQVRVEKADPHSAGAGL